MQPPCADDGFPDCNSNGVPDDLETDTDGDGAIDDCDSDDDNDGVLDEADLDPLNPDVCEDVDGDSCDDCSVGTDDFGPLPDNDPANDGTDTDEHGLCDKGDVCPNDDQNDADDDGVCGDIDNCELPNPDQADCQPNEVGDVCDIANGDSTDDNENGIPDECEGSCCLDAMTCVDGMMEEGCLSKGASYGGDGSACPEFSGVDCDANGMDDAIDLYCGSATDDNDNGIPDECEGPMCGDCPTDGTGNGNTGAEDLPLLLACWGPLQPGCECFDFNGSGAVGAEDLPVLLAAWGPCP